MDCLVSRVGHGLANHSGMGADSMCKCPQFKFIIYIDMS